MDAGNGQLLLAALVRHLDNKDVEANIMMKTNIVALTAVLARQSKAKATVAEVGAMSDLSKHLRRSLQVSMETMGSGNMEVIDPNISLQAAIEECLMEFGRRVRCSLPAAFDILTSTLTAANTVGHTISLFCTEAIGIMFTVHYLPACSSSIGLKIASI